MWISRRHVAALLFILAPLMGNAQTPPDNLQVFLQLFDRVAYRVAGEIARDGAAAIRLQPPASERPEERFFHSRLVTALSDTLALPIFAEPADSLPHLAVTYRLSQCEVIYRPLSGRRNQWQRTAGVLIEIGGHEAMTRKVLFQKIWAESAADTVAEKNLAGLEEANLPFTAGKRERPPRRWRWLEPALITSATGVIVYLFYALRSR